MRKPAQETVKMKNRRTPKKSTTAKGNTPKAPSDGAANDITLEETIKNVDARSGLPPGVVEMIMTALREKILEASRDRAKYFADLIGLLVDCSAGASFVAKLLHDHERVEIDVKMQEVLLRPFDFIMMLYFSQLPKVLTTAEECEFDEAMNRLRNAWLELFDEAAKRPSIEPKTIGDGRAAALALVGELHSFYRAKDLRKLTPRLVNSLQILKAALVKINKGTLA